MIKKFLAQIPYAPELLWRLRGNKPLRSHYKLYNLDAALPAVCADLKSLAPATPTGKKILIFATLHYWIEQAAMLGLVLRGMGHEVTLATLPYSDFRKEVDPFELRLRELHTRDVMKKSEPWIKHESWMNGKKSNDLPDALKQIIEKIAWIDLQYSQRSEDVNKEMPLYVLRLKFNNEIAKTALRQLQKNKPDLVLIPNGMILELGVVFQVAKHLGLPLVTYEFNDKKEQIWLAQNDEIMRQNTDALWGAKGKQALTAEQKERIEKLQADRRGATYERKSTRIWQTVESQGAAKVRAELNLDSRPVALLATNVLGDSLTLDRNIFSASMAEWMTRTIEYFSKRKDAQLVIRIHPGEPIAKGQSMAEVIAREFPQLPENIHVIAAEQKVNTYDLMGNADLGLAFTTTAGLEMCMSGLPVVSCGQTHYRSRGFTLDPKSYEEYFSMLDSVLSDPKANRLNDSQIEAAWNYAYRFFFEYAQPFPWRLMGFWDDIKTWTVGKILSADGQKQFGKTFRYLAGEPIEW